MHLTDEEVEALVNGADLPPQRSEHAETCADCARRVGESRAFEEMLAHAETWVVVDEIETARRSSPLQDLDDRLRREDAEAERLLGRLAASPYRFLWAILNVRKRRFRTGGVVRFLNRAAHDACERDPLHARNLADAAIAVAEALPDDLYPASGVEHLRGVAYKERANACRYLGEFDAALAALDRAERSFRRVLTPDLHLAIVDHVRATVLMKAERQDEAMRCALRAAAVFERCGETARWAQAQFVIGGIHFCEGRYEAARSAFADVLAAHLEDRDPVVARVQYDVGICELELGQLDQASVRLIQALAMFQQLDLPTEVVRTSWSLGRLAVLAGNAAEGTRRLVAARVDALRLRMSDDAAKITLDLVQGLLATGQVKEIPRLLTQALRHFRDAGQSAAVLDAAAYLRQAAAARSLTPALIDSVRRFIARAERDAALVFIPPS
ncbi:MAG TPA: tetratricopeptide repeat protein [Thermoanaerobaculia bacterium]|nr:tetratricopeptide repeat protein [Thermoanaerobaculia bacterium]